MTPFTEALALVGFDSVWDWRFSYSAFDLLAWLGSAGALVVVVVPVWRRFPLRGPYFSCLFVLGLCPFVLCATNAMTDIHLRMEGDWNPYSISEWMTRDLYVTLFGSLVSGLAILIYSGLYAVSRFSRDTSKHIAE